MSSDIVAIDHVQLAMPPGREAEARAFYAGLLGVPEVGKPSDAAQRGGAWFEGNGIRIHLGLEPDFRPSAKAHPAFVVRGLRALIERLRAAGVAAIESPMAGYFRVHVKDPFGNRIELMEREGAASGSDLAISRAVPILRIFDVAKAREFYLDFLGFTEDWQHRFNDNAPLYVQVSLAGLVIHLSEHHGDGSPGIAVRLEVTGLRAFHQRLSAKNYRYLAPEIETTPWGSIAMKVLDPFGNRLIFDEREPPALAVDSRDRR